MGQLVVTFLFLFSFLFMCAVLYSHNVIRSSPIYKGQMVRRPTFMDEREEA